MFDFSTAIHPFGIAPTLHSVVRYCQRFMNLNITEKEIHQNSMGSYTKNFDDILKAYDDINYYLKNPSEAYFEGVRLIIRGNEVVTVIRETR